MIKRLKRMMQMRAADDKRRFERIDLTPEAHIVALHRNGRRAGVLRQLARGGFSMTPDAPYSKDNKVHEFIIHEPEEDIRVHVRARVRSVEPQLAGFEFVDLDADAAVDIGIIIGKYYEHNKG
jgi:hypothetical protein